MYPLNFNLPEDFRQLSPMQKVVFCTGALAGLLLMTPPVLLALESITTIAWACVVGLGLFMGFSALPTILRWWRLRVLKLMKVIARRNPVETLQLELIDRRKAFAAASANVVAISAMRDSLREKLDEYVEVHRTKDPSLERSVGQMSSLVDRLRESLHQADVKLEEFDLFVARQAHRWQVAQAAGELATMLKDSGGNVTEQFLKEEAIDSIRNSLNLSFAQIDQILQKEEVKRIVAAKPPRSELF